MRLRRRRKPNYEHIAQLERELGLGYAPQDELGREIDEARMTALEARRKPLSGPVLLDKKTTPIAVLQQQQMQALAHFVPGGMWAVDDHMAIRNLTATAYHASAAPMPKPVSRVVLPAGVKA